MATKIAMKNRVKTVMESKEHLTTGVHSQTRKI